MHQTLWNMHGFWMGSWNKNQNPILFMKKQEKFEILKCKWPNNMIPQNLQSKTENREFNVALSKISSYIKNRSNYRQTHQILTTKFKALAHLPVHHHTRIYGYRERMFLRPTISSTARLSLTVHKSGKTRKEKKPKSSTIKKSYVLWGHYNTKHEY